MRDSEFKRAYLNIIKEGLGDMTMGEEVPPQEVTPEETATGSAKRICFTTSNEELIDLLRREPGFVEVVFFVPEKDEQGNETVSEVKLGKDAFEGIEISDIEAGDTPEEGEVEGECGDVDVAEAEEAEVEEAEAEEAEGEEVEEDLEAEDAEVEGECGECGCGEGEKPETETEDDTPVEEIEEAIDPSEWIEDGVCVKCGSSECDGTCKCKKCGSVNCIGDCEGEVANECGDVTNEEDEGGEPIGEEDEGDAGEGAE